MHLFSIYAVILFIGIVFMISVFFIKKALNSYEEYSLCGRSLTISYIFMTYLGTWISGGTIIGLIGRSYLSGVGNYWLVSVPYIVSFIFAVLFITRIRKLKQYSIGDILALRYPKYNEFIRIPVAIAIILRNVTVIGMQFGAISYLIVYVFHINRNLAVLITFLIITTYTALSGLWGVVTTDIFQGLLQTIGLSILFYYSIKLSGGWSQVNIYYESINKGNFLELFNYSGDQIGTYITTIGLFFLIGDQSDWQRINSCKTDKVAFWGYLAPLCVTLIWLLIPAYIGVLQRIPLAAETSYHYAIYKFIIELFHPKTSSFLLISLFAAVMSAADSYLLATGFTFSRDIVKNFINPKAQDNELIFWSKFFTIIAGGMGFAFAIIIDDLINLWMIGIFISTSILLVPYLFAWFSKTMNTEGAISGMLAGGISCIIFLSFYDSFSIHPVWIGMICNLVVSLVVSAITKNPDIETVMKTYYWSHLFKKVKNIP